MQFSVHNITHAPHDLDQHFIVLRFEMHFTEPEKMVVKFHCEYGEVLRFIKQEDEAFGNYLQGVRNGMDRHGPCEHLVFEAMGDEAIDKVYEYLELFLKKTDFGAKIYEHDKQLRNLTPEQKAEMAQKAQEIVANMKQMMKPEKGTNPDRHNLFRDEAIKQMRDLATKLYPEIFDADGEQLKEFKYLFQSEIFEMQRKIDSFAFKIREGKK
jgi:hypothetical protein